MASSALASTGMPDSIVDMLRHREYGQAIELLKPLVADGNAEAQYQLGRLYQRGLGVEKSERQARGYFEGAADAGHVESAYLLGTFYARDGDTEHDRALAAHWFGVAADSGHQLALRRLDKIGSAERSITALGGGAGSAESSPSSLCMVAENEDLSGIDKLINAGADAAARDANGATALHCGARSGSAAVLRMLINAGAPVRAADNAGDTPLHVAVASGSAAVAKVLLQAGADDQAKNAAGWSPVMLAERGGDEQIMMLLGVKAAGSRQATMERLQVAAERGGKQTWSKLALASWSGEANLVGTLIREGADVNATDGSGFSPVYRAVQANRLEVLQLLQKNGANLGGTAGDGTLLHVALRAGHIDMMGALLAHVPGGLLNQPDAQGETPLIMAISLESVVATNLLLKRGADANTGDTPPIVAAARYGLTPAVEALLAAGAQADGADAMGRSALWWAAKAGAVDIAEQLVSGGAVNLADGEGVSPWHVSAMAGHEAILALLATIVADPNMITASGSTALLLAAENGNLAAVERLLAQEIKVDAKNKVGDTALICAVRNDHKEVAARLIASGANPHMRNTQDMSALDVAKRAGDSDWEAILQDQRDWLKVLMSDA
ncbi:MAG: ankyrin repeat domain-containing protein [Gammaproteobacteria bacterium]|nr:ankyrin repeat domain-containing protein [Gammaproteobacteria bacterium]